MANRCFYVLRVQIVTAVSPIEKAPSSEGAKTHILHNDQYWIAHFP